MAVTAGSAPWSEGYKRTNRRRRQQQSVDWSLSSGYRQSIDLWNEKPKQTATKTVKLYNGRTVLVPNEDFDDFIGFQKSASSDPYSAVGQYIDKAFEDFSKVQEVEGVGHIILIEYVPRFQLLRVEFRSDGAVVVYFRVPKEVYSELYHLAQSKVTDADGHYALGKRFWDLIRIRGQKTGGRYRYEYAIEGDYTPKGTKLSREAAAFGTETGDDKEAMDLLNTFASRMLTGKALEQYRGLKTYNERYKFMRSHGLDWEE